MSKSHTRHQPPFKYDLLQESGKDIFFSHLNLTDIFDMSMWKTSVLSNFSFQTSLYFLLPVCKYVSVSLYTYSFLLLMEELPGSSIKHWNTNMQMLIREVHRITRHQHFATFILDSRINHLKSTCVCWLLTSVYGPH